MPRGNRMGPDGMGPMSGRGLGYCADYNRPGFANDFPRCGAGFGRGYNRFSGRGLGWNRVNNDYTASIPKAYSKEDELTLLKQQSEDLQNALNSINKRIEEIKE